MSNVPVTDLINMILLVVAIAGLYLTHNKMKSSYKTQKAIFFKELYTTMFSDSDIQEAYYKIEYNEFKYDDNFHGSENEKPIDHLLSFVNLVCELYHQEEISKKEMVFFEYRFTRIYEDENVKGYLEYLEEFYKSNKCIKDPFHSFVSYCER